MSIHIEFDLDYTGHRQVNTDGDWTPSETVEEAIIRSAGESLLAQSIEKSHVRWDAIKDIAAIKDEEIRKRIAPIVEEAFTKALQPTDGFGNPKGASITIAEEIVKIATEYLTKETGSYNKPETVVKKFIREEVERQVHGALVNAMEEAKKEVVAAVKEQGAEVLAKTISKMAGIQ